MQDIINQFLNSVLLFKNCSQHTHKAYGRNLDQFYRWATSLGFSSFSQALETSNFQQFIFYLRNKNYSPKSIKQKIASIKSLISYLNEDSPEVSVPEIKNRYKTDKKEIQTLNQTQIHILLNTIQNQRDEIEYQLNNTSGKKKRLQKQLFNNYRDHAIFALFCGSGIRIAELCNIDLSHIDIKDQEILIFGKGNRQRTIFFNVPEMSLPLRKYLKKRGSLPSLTSPALFLSSTNFNRITVREIQILLKKYLIQSELDLRITPHSLRHSYATISIEKGANPKAVSQILGHSSVRITLSMYTHLSKEHVQKVFALCHPLRDNRLELPEIINNRKKMIPYLIA